MVGFFNYGVITTSPSSNSFALSNTSLSTFFAILSDLMSIFASSSNFISVLVIAIISQLNRKFESDASLKSLTFVMYFHTTLSSSFSS